MKREKISGIYCIENLINHKKYIGWARDIHIRWRSHIDSFKRKNHHNRYLQNAWYKYGEENFKFWIIDEYPPIEEILKLMEIYFIAYYNSFNRDGGGYNLTRGGDGLLGSVFSEEHKNKISISHLGIKPSDETRKKMGLTKKGGHLTEEHKRKVGDSVRGEKNGNFGKFGVDNPLYNRKHTDEEKEHVRKLRLERDNYPKFGEFSQRYGTKLETSEFYGMEKRTYSGGNIAWSFRIKENGKRTTIITNKDKILVAKAYDKYVVEHNLNRPLNFPEDYSDRKVVK